MLRIGQPNAQPPDQEEAVSNPAVMTSPDTSAPDTGDSPTEFDQDELSLPKLDPAVVTYMGPEMGPFKCGNCIYFQAPSVCHIVSGDVAADGCCNLFTSQGAGGQADATEEAPEAPGVGGNADANAQLQGPAE